TRCTSSRIGPPRRPPPCLLSSIPARPSWTRATWRPSARRFRNIRSRFFSRLELRETVRRKRDQGRDSQGRAQDCSRQYVTEEVHAEHHARHADAQSQEVQRPLQRRIEITHHQRDRKRSHGVPGREGKLVRGQNCGPAVLLKLTWPRPMAKSLQNLENEYSENGRASGGADSRVAARSAQRQQYRSQSIPQPPVAHAR